MTPLPRDPFELVVPAWQELLTGLLIPSSVADRIRVDRGQPDVLPAELRQDIEPVAVVDAMPLSTDQLAAALRLRKRQKKTRARIRDGIRARGRERA